MRQKQDEQVLLARDRGQTSGATQRWLKPGFDRENWGIETHRMKPLLSGLVRHSYVGLNVNRESMSTKDRSECTRLKACLVLAAHQPTLPIAKMFERFQA